MAALRRELIDRKGWLSEEDFGIAFALARITPGTNVLAFCAAVAARIANVPGAILAVAAVTLPSAALAVLFTIGYESWTAHPLVMAAFAGMAAAVAGMMFSTVWLLVKPQWRSIARVAIFFAGSFFAAWKFGVPPVPIIAAAAIAGFLWKES